MDDISRVKNIGLMLTKNEAPILDDTLNWNLQFIDELYVLDGSDGDEAFEIIKTHPSLKWYMHERELKKELVSPIRDGIRQYVLNEIISQSNAGDWVTLLHGDELFFHNPKDAINLAESTGANCIKWFSPHFFPHKNDEMHWLKMKSLPVQERFTRYAHNFFGCWIEDRQFKLVDGMQYKLKQHRNVLPFSPIKYKALSAFPIFHHFKVWNLDPDSYTRTQKRRGGLRSKGKFGVIPYSPDNLSDFFVDQLHGFPRNSLYNGGFGKFENSYNKMVKYCSNNSLVLFRLLLKINLLGSFGFLILEKALLRRYFDLKKRFIS
jgi:hypothetical protein